LIVASFEKGYVEKFEAYFIEHRCQSDSDIVFNPNIKQNMGSIECKINFASLEVLRMVIVLKPKHEELNMHPKNTRHLDTFTR
jgi:hypothetical protein